MRKSEITDCESIYHLVCELEETKLPYQTFCEIYKQQVESDKYYCLVCESENKIIGVLNIRFEGQLHHAGVVAEIMEFVVDKLHRASGIGSAMLKEACRIANEKGCSLIEVACNQARVASHQFYLKQGMRNTHFKFHKVLGKEEGDCNAE